MTVESGIEIKLPLDFKYKTPKEDEKKLEAWLQKLCRSLEDYSRQNYYDIDEGVVKNIWETSGGNAQLKTADTISLQSQNILDIADAKATSFTIGANTLTTSEWAYLDGQNQSVFTTSDVTYNKLILTTSLLVDTPTLAVNLTGYEGRVGIGTVTPSQALDLIGAFELESTTSSTTGVIYKGAVGFIHNFHHPTGGGEIPEGKNTFVGIGAGNFTMGSTATITDHASFNTVVGYDAFSSNITGYSNVAIGRYTLHSNTTGRYITAVGEYALYNSLADNNSAFGQCALYSNTSGGENSALGQVALYYNRLGHRNTAVGYAAIHNSTTGSDNSALGTRALYYNTTGGANSALGTYAGRYIADGSTPNTTGDYNVFIGYSSKALADNDQNEVVIGFNSVGLGSNSVVLGNDDIVTTALKGNVLTNDKISFTQIDGNEYIDSLNDGYMDYGATTGHRFLTAPVTAVNYISSVAIGTSPYACTSTTVNTNLNADMTDGYHLDQDVISGSSPTLDGTNFTGIPNTGLTGFTDNRIAFGSATGGLEDDANLTWDGSTLTATGNLYVTGNAGIGAASTSTKKLNVVFSTAAVNTYGEYIDYDFTGAGTLNANLTGLYIDVDATSTSAKFNGYLRGLNIYVNDDSTAACSSYEVMGLTITTDSDHTSVPCQSIRAIATGLGANKAIYANAAFGTLNYSFYGETGILYNGGNIECGGASYFKSQETDGYNYLMGNTANTGLYYNWGVPYLMNTGNFVAYWMADGFVILQETYIRDGHSFHVMSADNNEFFANFHDGANGYFTTGGTNAGHIILRPGGTEVRVGEVDDAKNLRVYGECYVALDGDGSTTVTLFDEYDDIQLLKDFVYGQYDKLPKELVNDGKVGITALKRLISGAIFQLEDRVKRLEVSV